MRLPGVSEERAVRLVSDGSLAFPLSAGLDN